MVGTLLMLGTLAWAGPAPRWLRLCDKGPLETGTRAWMDAPLRADLLDSLRSAGWELRARYKWENLVSAIPGPGSRLPACVEDAGPVSLGRRTPLPAGAAPRTLGGAAARGTSIDEFTHTLGVIWDSLGVETTRQKLIEEGKVPGAGIRVAFMDGRFDRTNPVLGGARIVDAWDFVRRDSDPWDSTGADMHGTQTAGLLASRWDSLPGMVPGAFFLLYRTEDDLSETVAEEDNLAEAIQRAVDSGAQVISTSLGYRWFDLADQQEMHPWSDFDGRTLVASRAALEAARRGVVVVVSAGNEAGKVGGRSIDSPADADSILTVGAVDIHDRRCDFSSYGPTFDGRTKPDVVAYGCSLPIAGPQRTRIWGVGTSYSAPLVAGMAVLARQLLPGLSGQELVRAFRASGSLSNSVEEATGWGVPNLARLENLRSILGTARTGSPFYWARGALSFSPPTAQTGQLGIEMLDLKGRRLLRWEGFWDRGKAFVWDPSTFRGWKLQTVVVRWWGEYGEGATKFVLHP